MTTPTRTLRRPTWIALPLGLAVVGALALSPALAQDTSTNGEADATTATDAAPRAGALLIRRGHDGAFATRGMRFDPHEGGPRGAMRDRLDDAARRPSDRVRADGGDLRGDAFAHWLAADADAGPVVPGLIGRLADGTSVRLAFYDRSPEEGGAELGSLTFVAGQDDAATFRDAVRTAAEGASHVVVDVLGRVIPLPEAVPTDAAE